MHPNPAFRTRDRGAMERLIAEVGFAMIFGTTPEGPRVAHTPLVSTGTGAVRFHLARGNMLTRHLEGQTVLAVVNGPDAYVSPRWYADTEQVPTWNYLALELEGRVRKMDEAGLLTLLEDLSAVQEARIPGAPWTLDKVPESKLRGLLAAIVGFELRIDTWRPTFKLSQNKPADERERLAEGLDAQGAGTMAELIRALPR